ncbi:MAG: glycosyltransferase family 2 protein [Chloroherpetonaceae bacterium]|nr:glycosyltransferase family 2 protein [Chthonomonadaceae bacterium]MDW8207551.1 glycosyltransferase family 2 protein [Chloroherpetonaceae bacterium]
MNTQSSDTGSITLLEHEPVDASSTDASLLSVVVPAYNEEARIGPTLKRMLAYFDTQPYRVEILVVNDGSTDRTAQVVEAVAACRREVRLLSYAPNRGKGYAVRYGILHGHGTRLLFSDADLATPIEEIEKLMAQLDAGYDIAIGSRDVHGSELVRRQSLFREMGGKLFNRLVQLIAVPGIRDTQCGFKLFTREAAQNIFSRCQVEHFAFDVEVLYLALRLFAYRVAEVPVRWAHQEGSKVRFFRDALRMLRTLFRIRSTHYAAITTPIELPLR